MSTTPFNSGSSILKKPSINETMRILANHEKPFLALFINPTPTGTKADPIVKDKKHEWVEKKLKAARDYLNAAIASTDTTIYTKNQYVNYINNKSYITIDSEVMIVTASTYTSGTGLWTLTVTRGACGSTAAAHQANAPVKVENIFDEGADASDYESDSGVKAYNYTQIFRADVSNTGTAEAIETYGDENKMATQIAEKIPNLFVQLENALMSEVRWESGLKRKMGGLPFYVKSDMVFDSGSNKFNINTLTDDVNRLIDQGVDPSDILMSCGNNVRSSMKDIKVEIVRESMKIKELDFNFDKISVPGSHEVKIAPWTPIIPSDEYYLFPRKSVNIKFLRALFTEKLAKTGDSNKTMVGMEATTEFNGWDLGGALRRKKVG